MGIGGKEQTCNEWQTKTKANMGILYTPADGGTGNGYFNIGGGGWKN